MYDPESFYETFMRELESDDGESWEKKGEIILDLYDNASPEVKGLYDNLFITLCGWTIHTLIQKAYEKGRNSVYVELGNKIADQSRG